MWISMKQSLSPPYVTWAVRTTCVRRGVERLADNGVIVQLRSWALISESTIDHGGKNRAVHSCCHTQLHMTTLSWLIEWLLLVKEKTSLWILCIKYCFIYLWGKQKISVNYSILLFLFHCKFQAATQASPYFSPPMDCLHTSRTDDRVCYPTWVPI